MQINVAAERIDLSEALKARVAMQLDTIAATYFDDALEARVTFGQARSFVTCDINVHAGHGLVVRGEGEAADVHGAFDDAAEHIGRRLRRYRRRVNDHVHDLAHRRNPELGRQYILRQVDDRLDDARSGTPPRIPAVYATVVARQDTQIGTLSVGEAVMQLDLSDRPVLMFRNVASGGINVVYRRADGHVGWLDPDAAPH